MDWYGRTPSEAELVAARGFWNEPPKEPWAWFRYFYAFVLAGEDEWRKCKGRWQMGADTLTVDPEKVLLEIGNDNPVITWLLPWPEVEGFMDRVSVVDQRGVIIMSRDAREFGRRQNGTWSLTYDVTLGVPRNWN